MYKYDYHNYFITQGGIILSGEAAEGKAHTVSPLNMGLSLLRILDGVSSDSRTVVSRLYMCVPS